MEIKDAWIKLLEKYSIIKEVFIECEETDPELLTNLQPLNEFRAALDHIMKMNDAFYVKNDEAKWQEQYDKLNSHLDRAFFDICDLTSINYRNKILDVLEKYDIDAIRTALPQYYSEWKVQIEDISLRVSKYRNQKGMVGTNTLDLFQQYANDVITLRNIYKNVLHNQSTLEELTNKNKLTNRKAAIITAIGIIIGIVGLVLTIISF